MSPLLRFRRLAPVFLALRSMLMRRARTALTAMGIALGVAVVLAVNITNATLLSSLNAAFDEAGGRADLTVIDRARGGKGFEAGLLDRVRRVAGVTAAAPAAQFFTLLADDLNRWQSAISPAGVAAGNLLLVMGVDPAAEPGVRDLTLAEGRLLEPAESRYSVVLVETYAREHGYRLGNKLPILLPGGRGVASLTVVGLIERSGAGLINGGAVAFVPLPVAQELGERGGRLDRIDVVVPDEIADSAAALAELRERLAAALGENVRVIYPGARGEELSKRMASYRFGLDLFSLVAMFVGGFLIYNTFAMNVAERTREIGLFRAIGLTRRQILALVFTEAGLLSVFGSAAGLALGLGMAQGMSATLSVIAGSAAVPMTVPLDGFARSLALGLGVTFVSALGPALQAAGISPLQALRARAQTEAGTWRRYGLRFGPGLMLLGWLTFNDLPLRPSVAWPIVSLAALLFLLGAAFSVALLEPPLARLLRPVIVGLFGREGRLGAANLQRAQGRSLLTIAILMLGIGMSIGTASLGDSFRRDLSRWIEAATGGDLLLRSPARLKHQDGQRVAAIDGVQRLTAERFVEVWTTGMAFEDEIMFVAVEPETRQQISEFVFESAPGKSAATAFARLQRGGAVFVSTTLAGRYGLRLGDSLRLETPRGPQAFEVAGVVTDFTGNGLMVFGSWGDLRRYFGLDDVDRFIVQVTPGVSVAEVQRRIEARLGDRLNLIIEAVDDLMRAALEVVDQSFVMFDTLAFIVVTVSALGIINTMAISVLERQREIALLRSLGFTRVQVRRLILAEAAALGAAGGGLGLLLGFLLARLYIRVVQYLAGYELSYVISTRALVSSLVIALVISQLAALWPAIRAARREIVAALKEE